MFHEVAILFGVSASYVGLGYVADRTIRRLLGLHAARPRPITAALYLLAGMRLSTWTGHVSGMLGAPFRATKYAFLLAGLAALVWWLLPPARRYPRILRRQLDLTVPLFVVATALAVATYASFFVAPTQWDLYTMWLLRPHEIVAANSLVSFNAGTNVVVADYALQHSELLASAMLFDIADGRLNTFAPLFIICAALCVNGSLLFLRVRPQHRHALTLLFLLLVAMQGLCFAVIYCDSLVIFAAAAMALMLSKSQRSRSQLAYNGVVSAGLLVGKNYGYLIVLGTATIVGVTALLRRFAATERLAIRPGHLFFSAGAVMAVAVERVVLYALTVNVPESNAAQSTGGVLTGLSARYIAANFALAKNAFVIWPTSFLVFGTLVLLLSGVWFAVMRVERSDGLRERLAGMAIFALVMTGFLGASAVAVPAIVTSMPRYAAMLAPVFVALLGAAVAGRRRSSFVRSAALAVVGIAAVPLSLTSDYPSWTKGYFVTSRAERHAHRGRDPDDSAFAELRDLSARFPELMDRRKSYLLVNAVTDYELDYRANFQLVKAGYRGRLYSENYTSRLGTVDARPAELRQALRAGDVETVARLMKQFELVILSHTKAGERVPALVFVQPADYLAGRVNLPDFAVP